MKTMILALLMLLGTVNQAAASDSNEDRMLPLRNGSYYLHPLVADTMVYLDEYEGPTRFTAISESARTYLASLQPNAAYACTFSGRFAPCAAENSPLRGCDLVPNKIMFSEVTCVAK